MFKKILIANRGEIACRIIRTARRLGIATVAVYSEADRKALHVKEADDAYCIGPAPAAQSYLSIEALLAACESSGAEAVHPGYGFLSERAEFCRALTARGITFIGPNADAIERMGDKISARTLAAAAGVNVVPGSPDAIARVEDAVALAEQIGYPVMIKASAGGGGKGLRIAATRTEVEAEFAHAGSEAQAAFGDARVFIEKFIAQPRHIEIQVLGDRHGNLIHLGERECSIQRRHQKVIEEAPSPFVDAAMREAMGEQALSLARAVAYDSAGTVEFIVGADKSFYFLEMNTRLQVEHAVTECITGLDLVEEMIRSAAGEPLRLTQDQITIRGHAIESRLYAEDPQKGFLPSVGTLKYFRPPQEFADEEKALRIDRGVEESDTISTYYDPMIGKLVTYEQSRAAAIAVQQRSLDRFVIEGFANNRLFLAALMRKKRWIAGGLSTNFIAEEFAAGFVSTHLTETTRRVFLCVAASIRHVLEKRAFAGSGKQAPSSEQISVFISSERVDIAYAVEDNGLRVALPNEVFYRFDWTPADLLWESAIDGVPHTVQVLPERDGYRLSTAGQLASIKILSRRAADYKALLPEKVAGSTAQKLLCPMPGLLKKIYVEAGASVEEGAALCMIEAMKMEHVVRAPYAATVKVILKEVETFVGVDDVIMEFAG